MDGYVWRLLKVKAGTDDILYWDPIEGNLYASDRDSISHVIMCQMESEQEEGQWCSPGYWRQEHHLDAWEATGYSPEDLYPGTEYSLWYILQNPKIFARLGLYEAVGDLLSGAHPDVNFLGERIEDSCPLD
jgi:hypothetical protein